MIITEEEAKAKWCPEVRVMSISGEGGGNRWDNSGAPMQSPANSLCIGPACMAWRWIGHSPPFPGAGDEDELNHEGRRGYCGKAGRP